MPQYGVLQAPNPLLPFLAIPRLEVERLGIHGNRERAVVFVVDTDNSSFKSYAASTYTSHHLITSLQQEVNIKFSPWVVEEGVGILLCIGHKRFYPTFVCVLFKSLALVLQHRNLGCV